MDSKHPAQQFAGCNRTNFDCEEVEEVRSRKTEAGSKEQGARSKEQGVKQNAK